MPNNMKPEQMMRAYVGSKVSRSRIVQTLTEAANAVTFTEGDDGLPLNGKKGLISIIVPAGCSAPTGTSAPVYLQINDIVSGYYTDASDNTAYAVVGGIRNVFSAVTLRIDVVAGAGVIFDSMYLHTDGTTRTMTPRINGYIGTVAAITKIHIYLGSSYTLPAGTVIEYEEIAA